MMNTRQRRAIEYLGGPALVSLIERVQMGETSKGYEEPDTDDRAQIRRTVEKRVKHFLEVVQ